MIGSKFDVLGLLLGLLQYIAVGTVKTNLLGPFRALFCVLAAISFRIPGGRGSGRPSGLYMVPWLGRLASRVVPAFQVF